MADEVERDWYFTFGANHQHPLTGESLGNAYTVVHGTCDSSRAKVFEVFGNRWSMQYSSPDDAGVGRYRLTQFELPVTS